MSSSPIIAAILEKENAVSEFRKLIGATNPENAEAGTIRADFAESMAKSSMIQFRWKCSNRSWFSFFCGWKILSLFKYYIFNNILI